MRCNTSNYLVVTAHFYLKKLANYLILNKHTSNR
jgi:hypothetical protein